MTDDHLNAYKIEGIEKMQYFMAFGSGYATEQGTRPGTIGHIVSLSPLALLAWSVPGYRRQYRELTETFARAIYVYRQDYPPPPIPSANDPRWYIHKPFGYSSFPMEIAPLPRSWIETTGNLVFYERHQKGGHFAALEQPDELKSDLTKFVDQIWPGIIGAECIGASS
ncbi:hypothetical protein N7467_008520 [Penicillium canescens]|nr:hypothetical protein N7467_008520 [Penicillium canescens]